MNIESENKMKNKKKNEAQKIIDSTSIAGLNQQALNFVNIANNQITSELGGCLNNLVVAIRTLVLINTELNKEINKLKQNNLSK